ncbi:hypothetical protein PA27867_2479 [Cryobacterium arcticum]|uniref:Peptidase n=1 Tax=Cryobacterium arcticum TaxID=670052 RepID=A0A1B1BL97_9MICO|nr:hypothetical protein PA27867_2479 [Cryobacterium arcticum]
MIDVPAAAQSNPRAIRYIVDSLPPGTVIERRVEILNQYSSTQSVTVYAGSARIVSGSFIGDDGAAQNELTSWTSVSAPEFELGAGKSTEVTVTVTVPEDAVEGEQYAAIWAQVTAPAEEGATVTNASRVGVRMYVAVGPGNGAAADFSIGEVKAGRTEAGVPQVTAQVTNTGGRAVDVNGSLQLSEGPSALSAGPFATEKALTLAPGEDGTVVVALGSDLPDGPWRATLTLTSGLVTHEATADVTFPEAGESVAVDTDTGVGAWPFLVGAAALALMIALGATFWIRRRRTRRSADVPTPAQTQP